MSTRAKAHRCPANRAAPEGGVPDSDFPGAGGAGAQRAASADVPEAATAAALEERCSASQARPLAPTPHRR